MYYFFSSFLSSAAGVVPVGAAPAGAVPSAGTTGVSTSSSAMVTTVTNTCSASSRISTLSDNFRSLTKIASLISWIEEISIVIL